MRSDLGALLTSLINALINVLAPQVSPMEWTVMRRLRNLIAPRPSGAIALMFALATGLPIARAATPEELSRQYSEDWVTRLNEVQVPEAFQGVARARQIAGRLARTLGDGEWKVIVFRIAEMPRGMDVPAFALPSKYIAVSDWAASKDSDDQLAFVIGHEMGHVQLHHMDEIWRITMACAHVHKEQWTAMAAHTDCAIPVMRQQELEADTFGYALAAKAGFDARRGAREMLVRLQADELHPPPALRLENLGIEPGNDLKGVGRIQEDSGRAEILSRRACECSRLEK
ncbi:M48 family metallopeptidase [Paraburkholderia youngii]|uniref:M48 family metallopeptidase n=1 Tax=Paraburkholderia youngii TaxID=2782701 RepID=UPI003D194045